MSPPSYKEQFSNELLFFLLFEVVGLLGRGEGRVGGRVGELTKLYIAKKSLAYMNLI